jgi:DNA-binding MarR family transcriptional regulator
VRPNPSKNHPHDRPGACATGLVQLGSLISAELDRSLKGRGLSSAAYNVLRVLAESGGAACPYEISERLSVSRATVTGLLDSLESNRLVHRAPHSQDRRMLLVQMTERGRTLMARLIPEQDGVLRRMFGGLPAREQHRLVSLLARLQTELRQSAAQARG